MAHGIIDADSHDASRLGGAQRLPRSGKRTAKREKKCSLILPSPAYTSASRVGGYLVASADRRHHGALCGFETQVAKLPD